MTKLNNYQPLNELWAFVSVDKDGNEGIISASIGIGTIPLVTGDKDVLPRLQNIAQQIAEQMQVEVRLNHYQKIDLA